jgi:sugar lactone lactonase YvrE
VTLVVMGALGTSAWQVLAPSSGSTLPPPGWMPVSALLAGTGADGHADGPAVDARFSDPFAVATSRDGALYVADGGDSNSIRQITHDGLVSTVAGGREGFRDGIGAMAEFNTPSGLAIDAAGSIYVADTGNNAIRRITPYGRVITIAGGGAPGWQDGSGAEARFAGPMGLALDRRGLLVADAYNDRIRLVTPDGRVTTVAGRGSPGLVDGTSPDAAFDTPTGIALSADGSLFVADTGNDVVRRIDREGHVTTLPLVAEGNSVPGLVRPTGVAVSSDGRLYVADRRSRVIESNGGVTRVLAGGAAAGFANGIGTTVRFRNPTGLAVRADGAVIVADAGNRIIRLLDLPDRLGETLPAAPTLVPGFDLAKFARVPLIWPVEPQEGPHEVAGTVGEARGSAGGEGRERFHAGIDIHAPEGSLVLAVRDGKIDLPISTGAFGLLNEYISIGPITYVHLRVARDRHNQPEQPEEMPLAIDVTGLPSRVRVRRGWRVRAGEVLGSVNRFQHVHLNVGPVGEEANPLLVGLPQFRDTIPPTIAPKGIEIVGANGDPIAARIRGRVPVCGPVGIVVEAWDRVDGNPPTRRLGLFRLGYQVLDVNERPVAGFETPRVTLEFDRLPSDADAPRAIYAPGSGIPFYGTRRTRFRYVVTTRVEDGRAVDAPWDSRTVPAGNYLLRVFVADAAGNAAVAGRDLPIVVLTD